MRFVIGLCFGALVTLGLAVIFDVGGLPTARMLEQMPQSQEPQPEEPAAASIPTFEPPSLPDDNVVATNHVASAEPEPDAQPDVPALEEEAESAAEDATFASLAEAPPDNDFASTDAPTSQQNTALDVQSESEPVASTADSVSQEAFLEPELSSEDAATAHVSVWKPFHSEISAQGFAKRLTLQLGYPFSVIKAGPAQYHVVFSYVEDSQRDTLTAQIAALTGVTPK